MQNHGREIKKLSVPWQISIYSVYAESKIVRSRYFETWPIIQYNTLSTIHICWFWAISLTTFYILLNLIIIQSTHLLRVQHSSVVTNFRLFDELAAPPPPRSPHKQLLARLLPRSVRRLRASPVQSVLAPLYSLHYTPGAKVGSQHAKLLKNPQPSDHFKMCELFIWSECSQT